MKILVLSTGGTIGSATKDGVMSPDKNATALLVLLYESSFQDVAEFDCESVSDILSENVTEPFYEKLINRLLAVDTEKYDGVIVLHGTDTLAYTSSLAAMVCRSLPIPVGFVGANYPLKHPKSNAFVNFRAAVEYLKAGGRGVLCPIRKQRRQNIYSPCYKAHRSRLPSRRFPFARRCRFGRIQGR